jgi:hypothetical protein
MIAEGTQIIAISVGELRFLFKIFLAYAAKRTLPIIGKISEKSAGLDAVIRIADFFIIDVAANCANKFCHGVFPHLSAFLTGKAIL